MAQSYHYIQTWHPKQKHLYSSSLYFLEFLTIETDICTQNTLLYLKCLTSYHPISGAKGKKKKQPHNNKTIRITSQSLYLEHSSEYFSCVTVNVWLTFA